MMLLARSSLALTVSLLVGCAADPVATSTYGTITVDVSASGESRDTAFTLNVASEGVSYAVTVGEDLSFTMDEGSYSLELVGVADNCGVEGVNPQTADVSAGGTVRLEFAVTCTNNGTLKISVATRGDDFDDMYTLSFDDGDRTILVGPNQFVLVSLPVKSYSLELKGVADNCTVAEPNPLSVGVLLNTQTTASFAVACVAR